MNASRITHHASRITLPLLLAALIGAGLFVLVAAPARADEPCDNPEEIYLENSFTVESSQPNMYFQAGTDYWDMICSSGWCNYGEDYVSISQPVSFQVSAASQLVIKVQALTHGNGTTFRSRVHFTDDTEAATSWRVIIAGGEVVLHAFDLSSHAGKSIDNVFVDYKGVYGYSEQYRFFPLESYFYGCPGSPTTADLCPLVQNGHFAAADGWLLDGGAVISPTGDLHTLDLPAGGIAAQNLTLESNKTYNAVISATQVSAATSLSVVLGTQSEALDIAEPGLYTATFTTSELSGPVLYSLENSGAGEVVLDFACVSLATGDGAQPDCLAPENGTFDTNAGWDWYRGAQWNNVSQNASLPYVDGGDENKSLIVSTSSFTLPTITAGQYLLFSFEARSSGRAILSSQAGTVESEYEIYPNIYTFETDVSHLAGQTVNSLAFANTGVSAGEFAAEGNIYLDNVCVYISDHASQLPDPASSGGLSPVNFGWNYGCADVPAILAGLGLNVFQLEEIHAAGVSLWEPSSWVPWLAAALWVNAIKPLSCLIMAVFGWLVGLLQTFLNNILNYANWLRLSALSGVNWLHLWFDFIGSSLKNLSNAYGRFLASWASWLGRTFTIYFNWIGQALADGSDWIGQTLANLSDGLAKFLADWSDWIALSLANSSAWVAQTLADGWAWLVDYFNSLNGLRAVVNWLIDGWNAFLNSLGAALSQWADGLVKFWNESFFPFLQGVWDWLIWLALPISLFGVLLDLSIVMWDLFWMLLGWIWANVFVAVNIPINFYYAFNDGVQTEAFSNLMSCAGTNFWCGLLAGTQMVNQTVGHTVLYPIVIMVIILGTIGIFWRHLWALFSINIR